MWLHYVPDLDDCPLRGGALQNLQKIHVSCVNKKITKFLIYYNNQYKSVCKVFFDKFVNFIA